MIVKSSKNFQDMWMREIKANLCGSPFFVSDVINGVFKNELNKPRAKEIKKDIAGRVIEKSAVSLHVVESIARRESNIAIADVERELLRPWGLNLSATDAKIVEWCEAHAIRCGKIVDRITRYAVESFRLLVSIKAMESMARKMGLLYPVRGKKPANHLAAIMRMCSARWWRRQIRTMKARVIDQMARSLRLVHARGQAYCSDEVVRIKRAQRHRNRMLLEGMEAENGDGDKYMLSELADLSTSNPAIRKAELMVRMRGFEQVADELGHVGIFATLTAPSRFHPARQVRVKGKVVRVVVNDAYKGATARDAQNWMCKTWSRVRAAWDKAGIKTYGFRVVEPHADGCPHWHALLFFQCESEKSEAMKIVKEKFLQDGGDERGAQKYRVKLVPIDKSKGSATGYIAKYISKNIDGQHIENDTLGLEASKSAERILSWASTYGARQFQQIGGASVQVWRELRRVDSEGDDGVLGAARAAADASDWAAYCMVMGGVFVRRDDQPIRLARWLETEINYDTGEEIYLDDPLTGYGEESPGKIFGLKVFGWRVGDSLDGVDVISRVHRWVVERIGIKYMKEGAEKISQEGLRWLRESGIAMEKIVSLPVTEMDADLLADLMRGDGLFV